MTRNRPPGRGTVLFVLVSGAVGGGQRIALSVAQQLVARSVPIAAVAPDGGPSLEEFGRLGARTAVCGRLRSFSALKALRLAALARKWRVSVVYAHTTPVPEAVCGAAARLAGAQFVVHRHIVGQLSSRPLRRRLQLIQWRWCLRAADEVISVSRAVQANVASVSGRSGPMVPNGVPIPDTVPPMSEGAPLIALIGRLDPNKRIEDFVEAAAEVRRRHPEARFLIVGSGVPGSRYEDTCRAFARRLGFEETKLFLGAVPRADDILRGVDILVVTSQLEGHPLIVLEAMALGRAVVVTNIDGCKETVDDRVHGRVVPVGNSGVLAETISELLNSPIERAQIGLSARARVIAQFSEEQMLRRLVPLVAKGLIPLVAQV